MKKNGFLFLFLIFLGGAFAFAWTGGDKELFEKANQAYTEGKFEEAGRAYKELTQKYPHAASLYYNLGNSRFRQKAVGPAILAYEKALTLEPRNPDIRRNLAYLRGLSEYRIEDKRNWYVKFSDELLRYFTGKEIWTAALAVYFLFMAGWLLALVRGRNASWGWIRKTLLILTALAFTTAGTKSLQMNVMRDAVVTEKQAEVRYGPSSSDQIAFRLAEGLKVQVVEKRASWSRILLVNGESGWVQNSQIGWVQGS